MNYTSDGRHCDLVQANKQPFIAIRLEFFYRLQPILYPLSLTPRQNLSNDFTLDQRHWHGPKMS